jgi:hypothetical protein
MTARVLIPKSGDVDAESLEAAFVISQVPEDKISDPKYFYSQFWMNRIRMDHGIEVRPARWTWKRVYYSYKIYISYAISNREPIVDYSDDTIDLCMKYKVVTCTELTKTEIDKVIADAKIILHKVLRPLKVQYECVLDQKNKRLMIFMDIEKPFKGDFDDLLALKLEKADIASFRKTDKEYYVDFIDTTFKGY